MANNEKIIITTIIIFLLLFMTQSGRNVRIIISQISYQRTAIMWRGKLEFQSGIDVQDMIAVYY